MADESSGRQGRWMEMHNPGPAFPGVTSQSIVPRKFRRMATRITHDNPTPVVAFSFVPVVFCPCGLERQKLRRKRLRVSRFGWKTAFGIHDLLRSFRKSPVVNFGVGGEATACLTLFLNASVLWTADGAMFLSARSGHARVLSNFSEQAHGPVPTGVVAAGQKSGAQNV